MTDWDAVWAATAGHLGRHSTAGLSALLTEDVVRFALVQELVSAGVSPTSIEVEWRRPGITDSVDLVLTGHPWAAVELKYPREPRVMNAAWTQHLGEVLKDFYRLATMPSEFEDRWCIQLWSRRVNQYFEGVDERHGVRLGLRPGLRTDLSPTTVSALPKTATGALGRWMPDLPAVSAVCVAAERVSDDLQFVVHRVEPAGGAAFADSDARPPLIT